ncbi:MAG TPA: aminopeptidase [Actinomycetota bacterium]|nr:aminopeptidase [Actinomycetota bacterium]
MTDERVERLAEVLIDYSTRVVENELVLINGNYVAEPLMLALYQRVLERGAHPMLRASIPAAEPILYRFARDHQLEYVWEPDRWLSEHVDVGISIISDTNTRQLSRVDPERQIVRARARKPLMDTTTTRFSEGDYRWVLTLFPTEAHAMDAQMSLREYEDLYYASCFLDEPDPVAAWKELAATHARMIEWMEGRSEVHLEGEGTDLTLAVGGRTFIAASGTENLPDGEIFTGPHEDATRGHITFTYPAIYGGQAVEGARLQFDAGRVVDAGAIRNEDFLVKTLDTDPGARVLGELGIGTNYGLTDFTGEILLDEKIGGTVHLALGSAYPETGGVNDSAIHWDMVCDLRRGGRITVDGDVLLEDGRLLI